MMFELTNMSKVVLVLIMLVEVSDSIGDREYLGFLDTSQEAHLVLGVEVLIMKVIKVLSTKP